METTTNNINNNLPQTTDNTPVKKHNTPKIIGISVGSVVGIIVLLLIGVNLYLTPDRLQRIINEEGRHYLNADVKVTNVDYTLWSSFPNLRISIGSVEVNSRSLDGMASEILPSLPKDSRQLLKTGKISGGINIWNALRGHIDLRDIEVEAPSCNLVAVNDSVANFYIFPKMKKAFNLPHISLNTVKISSPVTVKFYNVSSKLDLRAIVNQAEIRVIEDKKDNYLINIAGAINVKNTEVATLKSLPIDLNAKVTLGFSPLSVTVTDCKANLAVLKTISDISLITDNDNIVIGKLNLDFSCNDLLAVTDYLSFPNENEIEGIGGKLPVFAKLNLEAPYQIPEKITDNTPFPAFSFSVNIPEGKITYPMAKNQLLNLRNIALHADLYLDPHDAASSTLMIPIFKVSADGANVDAFGKITELMSGDPVLDATVNCNADLGKTAGSFLAGKNLKIAGLLQGETNLSCHISGLKDKTLKDLSIKGDYTVASLKINDVVSKLTANLQNISLKLRGSVPELSTAGLGDSRLNLIAGSVKGKINMPADTTTLIYKNLTFNGQFGAKGSVSNPTLGGTINLKAGNFNASSSGMKVNANGVGVDMTAAMRHVPWSSPSNYSVLPSSVNDSIISNRVTHTPLYLVTSIPYMLQTGLSLVDMTATIKLKDAEIATEAYPAHNSISNLIITTDLDNFTINNLQLTTRGADAKLSGKISGLRNFLMASTPVPLKIDLDAGFSDVDINRLAGNYYAGLALITGKPADYDVTPLGAYTADDSLCVLIPRNLYANIRLNSDRAEYMGWQFSPLSTNITLHNGVATLGDLCIGTGYGNVDIDWTYSTADLNDIFMKLNVGINDFDFKNFFKAFPEITASAPEMENLSGKVSANIDGKVLMFPSMFINAPSMTANVDVHTSDITFNREGKIKTITNLMLIKGDSALAINNLDIHGSFHDNMLQLDPFKIDCGPYEVGVAGVNNLQGEMYYHLGLLSSPIHLPFGVNLVGNWRHPGIRFGGAGINDGRERKISANLADNVNVNIMRELKHGWQQFIEIAAKYDAQNNQQYVFNVD